jgi:hypothetical protein
MAKKTTRRRKAGNDPEREVRNRKPSAATAGFRGGRRRPAGRGQDGYPPFIAAEDLIPQQPERFKILPAISLFQRNDGTSALFIQIERRSGERFTFGLNCGSPDRISIQNQIGRNIVEWPGQTVTLHRVRTQRGGQFVNVFDQSYTDQRRGSAVPAEDDDIPF